MNMRCFVLTVTAGLALVGAEPASNLWDSSGLKVSKPEDRKDVKVVPAPEGAMVLLDANSLLKGWVKVGGNQAPSWKLLPGGVVQVQGGNIRTKQEFKGPFKLHVEFRVPYLPKASGQGRGNSGVYVQGRYEVQVLDSYGLKSQSNDCGGIYGVSAPRVNACKAPAVWQSYDIDFTPPACADGKITKPGRMTVHQNGILIQDDVALADRNGKPVTNTTAGLGGDPCKAGPIMLQDHGNPVQYRNIWLLPGLASKAK